MTVRIMIRRKIKEGHMEDAHKLLARARYNAFHQKGYVGSETLTSIEDPNAIIIISTWQSIEHWEAWRNNEFRNDGEGGWDEITAEPTIYESYSMGMEW